MPLNVPNVLTLMRLALVPVFISVYHLPHPSAPLVATILFVLAAVTDWLDGWLARRLQQSSAFGAFLDPVADKLMVLSALVLLVSDGDVLAQVWDRRIFAVVVLIILGREIAVSALREWMAELGKRASVAVSVIGKLKTIGQMLAIPFLLYQQPVLGIPVFSIGEALLYLAAGLTLWSMAVYLRAAWPEFARSNRP